MELAGLRVVLDADISKLQKAFTDASAYMSAFSNATKNAFSNINIDVNGIKNAGQATRDAAAAARDFAKAKIDEARAANIAANAERKARPQDEYGRLVAESNALVREYYNQAAALMRMGDSAEDAIAKLDGLRQKAIQSQDALKTIEAGAGRFQRNVGNYASAFNPLSNSINQLTREMPAFANSMQTGFMAISNNLPMLADALGQIKARNAELMAQGQPAKSVFSQLAGAVFSWQTALSVGITLLTLYGPKIIEMITGTEGAAEAKKKLKKEQEELNRIDENALSQAATQISRLKLLQNTLESNTASTVAKKSALKELQDTYPSYFQNLDMDAVKNGRIAEVIRNSLIPAILAAARARAYSDKLEANVRKQIALEEEQVKLTRQRAEAQTRLNNAVAAGMQGGQINASYDRQFSNANRVRDERDAYDELSESLNKNAKERQSIKAANDGYAESITKLQGQMGSLNSEGKDYATTLGKVTGETKKAREETEKLAEVQLFMPSLTYKPGEASAELKKQLATEFDAIKADVKPLEVNVPAKVHIDWSGAQALGAEISERMAELIKGVAEELSNVIGEGLGDMLSGDGTLGNLLTKIAGALGSFLTQVGKMLINTSIKMQLVKQVLEKLSVNPAIGVAAGIALVALGSVIKNNINRQQVKLATGGIAYGPTNALIGEYSGAQYNPEVVAPLDKLQGILVKTFERTNMGGRMNISGELTAKGTDLKLILDRVNANSYT